MSQAVTLSQTQSTQSTQTAQDALAVLNDTLSYYSPEALPAKETVETHEGYVDYYSEAA